MSGHPQPNVIRPAAAGGVLTVPVGSLVATDDSTAVLNTPLIGASLAVCAYSELSRVGALVHFLLPDSQLDERRRHRQPEIFADSGIERLLTMIERYAADTASLRVHIVGGADAIDAASRSPAPQSSAQLGVRNIEAATRILAELGLECSIEHCGGRSSRRVGLDVATGRLRVHTTPNPTAGRPR